jgi:hypothetical protein
LVDAENKLLEALIAKVLNDAKFRSIHYLNVCDWFGEMNLDHPIGFRILDVVLFLVENNG